LKKRMKRFLLSTDNVRKSILIMRIYNSEETGTLFLIRVPSFLRRNNEWTTKEKLVGEHDLF
jgi:hypothetical protein